MSTRLVAPMMPVLLLASCNSIGGERMSRDELLSPAMVFTDLDVEEIDALQPQLPVPFRLGIAPPIEPNDSRLRASAWSPGEKEVLDAWGKKMLDVGLVSEIEMLPGLLIGSQLFADADSFLTRVRQAAARTHVDAVLIVHRRSNSYNELSPLILLDLTIVGAFVLPSHTVHIQTAMEGIVIDTRNEYLYVSANGYAEDDDSTASWYVHQLARSLETKTRGSALQQLAGNLTNAALGAGWDAQNGSR